MARRRARPVLTPWARRLQARAIPVKEGDVVDVAIEGVDHKGRGLARIEGFPILIPNTNIGETVTVTVKKVTGGFAIAHRFKREANQES